jgi:hypothetical protein
MRQDKVVDPVCFGFYLILEPGAGPIDNVVAWDTEQRWVGIVDPPAAPEAPAEEEPKEETPNRRRRIVTDGSTPLRRAAEVVGPPAPRIVFRDYDVRHADTGDLLYEVRQRPGNR